MKILSPRLPLLIAGSAFAGHIECKSPTTDAVIRIDDGRKTVEIVINAEFGGMLLPFIILNRTDVFSEGLPSKTISTYALALAELPE